MPSLIKEYDKGAFVGSATVDGNNVEGALPEFLQASIANRTAVPSTTDTVEAYLWYYCNGLSNTVSLHNDETGLTIETLPESTQPIEGFPSEEPMVTDAVEPDLADLLTEVTQKKIAPIVTQWLKLLKGWVGKYDTLEQVQVALRSPQSLYNSLKGVAFEDVLYQQMLLADLGGRAEVLDEMAREDALRPEWLRLAFKEAIAALRKRVIVPAASYKTMDEGYHDWAFSVTGMTRGDLLDDAKWLIDRGVSDGTSYDDLFKMWDRLIGRKGWQPKGNKDRRLYTIIDTNIRSSYGTGRGQQMLDPAVSSQRPYILWRWRDSRIPRPHHQALNNKAIASDNPFWQKVRFPCGFGCKCGGYAVSGDYLERSGYEILTNPPNPETIADPGFRYPLEGYTGAQRQQIISDSLGSMSPEIRSVVEAELGKEGELS